jgi:hypothetical protein
VIGLRTWLAFRFYDVAMWFDPKPRVFVDRREYDEPRPWDVA